MPDLIAPLAFAFGTVLGSFLNVVILRSQAVRQGSPAWLPRRLIGSMREILPATAADATSYTWHGRSRCPRCQSVLRWFELIPLLSFMVQRGRCRRCHQPISSQYPLVEASTGLAAMIIFTPPPAGAGFIIAITEMTIFSLLLILFVIDLKTFLLPDRFIVSLALPALVHVLLTTQSTLLTHAGGTVIGAGSLAVLWLVTQGRGIGLGDVKLMIPLGFFFGPLLTVMLLFLAFIAGGLLALILLAARRVTMKTAIPFGPFLSGAALTFLLVPELPAKLFSFV